MAFFLAAEGALRETSLTESSGLAGELVSNVPIAMSECFFRSLLLRHIFVPDSGSELSSKLRILMGESSFWV